MMAKIMPRSFTTIWEKKEPITARRFPTMVAIAPVSSARLLIFLFLIRLQGK